MLLPLSAQTQSGSLSHDEAKEQASNELRWIREAAGHPATRADGGEDCNDVVERMVNQVVHEHKPLAYVLGTQPFHPLPVDLLVRPPTLIPRPETEHWVNELIQRITTAHGVQERSSSATRPFRILDVGTGTGCIALALTHGLAESWVEPPRRVQAVSVDQSEQALALARENAMRCGLLGTTKVAEGGTAVAPTQASEVVLREADIFSPEFSSSATAAIPSPAVSTASTCSDGDSESVRRFDLVVSNPPYIPLREYLTLEANVRDWEDRRALVGEAPAGRFAGSMVASQRDEPSSDDGLIFYRRIISILHELLLTPDTDASSEELATAPVIAFEVGKGQARAVAEMLARWRHPEESPIAPSLRLHPEVVTDPWGVERAVFARWQSLASVRHEDLRDELDHVGR